MPRKVFVTGHGWVFFPDDSTDQEIHETLLRDFPPPDPTVAEYAKSTIGAFAQGAADTVASIPQAAGIATKFLSGSDDPVEEGLPWKLGQGISDTVERALPEDPRLKGKSFLFSTLPQALGSTVGFAGTGAVGELGLASRLASPAAKALARTAITAGTGAAAGGVEGYRDAKANGADDATAFKSALLNAGMGLSEAAPISRIFDRINVKTGGALRALYDAGLSAAEEGTQEALQSSFQNLVAQNLYDEDRALLQTVGESGLAGAASGLLMTLAGKGVHRAIGGKDEPRDPAAGMVISTPQEPVQPAQPAPAPVAQPVEVTPTLANDLEASIKGNQLAPEPAKPAPAAEPSAVAPEVPEPAGEPATAKRPKFDDKAPNPAESRVSSLAAEDQVHEALTLGELPLGEWTEEQRQLAEALRKGTTLQATDKDVYRMIFSRATNEDRHLNGEKVKNFLTADSDRKWQAMARGEYQALADETKPDKIEVIQKGLGETLRNDAAQLAQEQTKNTVLPETDKIPAQNQENRSLGEKPKNQILDDEIPMDFQPPPKRGPVASNEMLDDDQIPPSARMSLAPKPLTREDVENALDSVQAQLPGATPTVVVQSVDDLPEPLRNERAQAALWRGKTYLVADNLADEQEAIFKWTHEQVGHHGLRSILGDDMDQVLDLVFQRYQQPAMRAELDRITRTYDLDLSTEAGQREAAEEILAKLAETNPTDASLWREVVAWFKKAWRKLTGGDISEDEVRQLIRRAYRQLQTQQTNESNLPNVQRGELPQASEDAAGAPKFSKKSKPNTFIQQQDELLGKLADARRAGDTKEVERLRTEVEALEKAQFGQSVKRKTNDLLDEEDLAPQPMPSADRRAAVRMVQGVTTNPTVDAATWWTQLKRWLRNFATPLPELPLLGQDSERFAAVRRWFRAVSSETELSRKKAERMISDIIRPIQELGRDLVDPNTVRKYQDLTNRIHAEWVKGEAKDSELVDKLNAELDALEPAMEKNPWHLFSKVIIWRDLNYRTNVLKTEDGNDITPPAGLTKEDVAATSREAQEAVEASEHKDAIKEALKRHYAFVERMQKELEDHGEVIPDEMKNPDYFPHHILDGWTGKLAPVRATTEGPWRPYMQPITGTEKLHQSDYLAAMYKHASDVLANNAQVALVERDIKPYDIAKKHLAELEEQFDPDTAKRLLYDEKYLPAGYTVIRPSEHLRLSASYVLDRTTLSEKLGKAIAEDEDLLKQLKEFGAELEISAEDIREALTVGEQVRWIVPQEVADVLTGIKKREDAASNPGFGTRMFKPLATVQKLWKLNTLFNPLNYVRYEYGNTMTDVIDKVFGLDPGLAKYLKQSLREIREAANGNTTPEYDAALKEGVMQTVTAGEAEELAKLANFEDFLTSKERAKNTMSKVLTFTTGLSAVRESTFRYAKFLADLDRIKKGERPVYGGAFHKEVEAQQTPEQKAGLISRKSFGDYQDISVAGATFRKYIFPFWSWQEVNMKYHANLFRNMVDMVKLGDIMAAKHAGRGAAVATTKAAVGIVLRLAVARVAIEAWNQVGGKLAGLWDDDDDLEAKLSEADRRRLHIILGKDEKGRALVVYVPNAMADVMEWVGGNNFSRLFVDWASGDISLGRFARDYAKQVPGDFLNKVAQAVRPEAKFAYTMVSGKDPFPDVLNQRSIDKGDWYWMLAQAMDRDMAMKLRQELDPYFYNPESAGDWWQRKILQVRRRDPEQWAYFEIRDLAADFKEEKTGKRFEFGSYMSADQKVIRNFRKAIYNADMENAQKFYEAALGLGYTSTRFKASLKAQDPLNDLNKEQQKEFEASLNPYEKRMLKLAKAYYGRMASGKGQEAELFPKKEGRPFTGRPEKLRELIESGRGR